MSINRTIDLCLSTSDMIEIAASIGTYDKLWEAIGYLSSWNQSYPKVCIYRDRGDDLYAIYLNAEGETKYVIGAVWHDDHYGFHS
jgi:hypothetical protein